MDKENIKNLAELAKINLTDDEIESFSGDFKAILDYVSQIESVSISSEEESFWTKNLMREDENPNSPGEHRENVISEVPHKEGDFVRVKKIL